MNQNIQLKISGMSCGHCQAAVNELINEVEGVASSNVDLEGGMASVTFDDAKASIQQIVSVINDSEVYKAEIIST